MHLIFIQENKTQPIIKGESLLKLTFSSELLSDIFIKSVNYNCRNFQPGTKVAIPDIWSAQVKTPINEVIYYKDNMPLDMDSGYLKKESLWSIVSNGRFAASTDSRRLSNILSQISADVVLVNVEPKLRARQEKLLIVDGHLAGFRRFYQDMVQPSPISDDWPSHVFIKNGALRILGADKYLPLFFESFVKICFSKLLKIQSLSIAGSVLDLGKEDGLLNFLLGGLDRLDKKSYPGTGNIFKSGKQIDKRIDIAYNARLSGKILAGQNIFIGENTVIAGPAIICDNVKIENGAVISESIIGPNVTIMPGQVIQNRIVQNGSSINNCLGAIRIANSIRRKELDSIFRSWPRFSYAVCFKRIIDIVIASFVLILFAPFIPIMALAVKITSSGPVFFKGCRQGLHGKDFNCFKFRTMYAGSDIQQNALRCLNKVDGPQFSIPDDPRISPIGRFLRDTFIDEIPQLFNVLIGQMSFVGPRPSPESENTLCPYWRDTRLSVRPGMTGLWQVCRTRDPKKDFQEWIYYDIRYVRGISLKLDLWIIWKTIQKVINSFLKQF